MLNASFFFSSFVSFWRFLCTSPYSASNLPASLDSIPSALSPRIPPFPTLCCAVKGFPGFPLFLSLRGQSFSFFLTPLKSFSYSRVRQTPLSEGDRPVLFPLHPPEKTPPPGPTSSGLATRDLFSRRLLEPACWRRGFADKPRFKLFEMFVKFFLYPRPERSQIKAAELADDE